MFNILSNRSLFEQYYAKFISQKEIKKAANHKPITAAYLFVISDFVLMMKNNFADRNINAQKIFTILEKNLSSTEMDIFDTACDLFGKIIRHVVSPRGDWCMSNDKGDNPIYNLYLCYGDLIYAPNYLYNYENAPIQIIGITDLIDFASNFNPILHMTVDYMDRLGE